MLIHKKILLVSPEPWNHIFVSKHHYAIHLAQRGNVVFFLNPPSGKSAVEVTAYENLHIVNYTGFIKGLRFLPAFIQRMVIRSKFESLQRALNVTFDVIWSFDNSVFFDFCALPGNLLTVSHIVDLNQDFQSARAARTAQVCFCTSDVIFNRLIKYNSNVFKINHGFNFRSRPNTPVDSPGKSKIKALYAGNLAIPFIDWITIQQIVKQNLEIDFIFAGPNKEVVGPNKEQDNAKREVLNSENAFFLGKIPSDQLLLHQWCADVLFVAYQDKYHADQATNPHKMMEYLGSGKMIVATFTAEYVALRDRGLILMSAKNDELPALFKHALQNLESWNSAEMQLKRREIALDNTYAKQIERIERILKSI